MKEFDAYLNSLQKLPHLIILGAGATKAVIPVGDRYGEKTACMGNFIKELNLDHILEGVELKTKSENIEDIYSELFARPDCASVRENLEKAIYEYFKSLRIPDEVTLYDLLLLSLRETDFIASFNWDDLLIQSYQRVSNITDKLPKLAFLHGNVSAGVCPNGHEYGSLPRRCHKCDQEYIDSPLLYPIKNKDYTSDIFIKTQWENFKIYLRRSGKITIWGYSAPTTDVEAIKIMNEAFSSQVRTWQECEIIDIADENKIRITWSYFGELTHEHIKVYKSFFNSSLAKFPRRTMEGFYKCNYTGWFGSPTVYFSNQKYSFKELEHLVKPLLDNEKEGNFEVI